MTSHGLPNWSRVVILASVIALASVSAQPGRSSNYDDLVSLFAEWRNFQRPTLVNGVPDYTAPTRAKQHKALSAYQSRLAAIDAKGWPVPRGGASRAWTAGTGENESHRQWAGPLDSWRARHATRKVPI